MKAEHFGELTINLISISHESYALGNTESRLGILLSGDEIHTLKSVVNYSLLQCSTTIPSTVHQSSTVVALPQVT